MSDRHITKTLATCAPTEFLYQTNRIRKSVETWLHDTGILNIRKNKPNIPDNATEEEKRKAVSDQIHRNLSDMLDNILDKHPKETLNLLALLCFVEPENIDEYPVKEYLKAIASLIDDDDVISFFTSLARLDRTGILH